MPSRILSSGKSARSGGGGGLSLIYEHPPLWKEVNGAHAVGVSVITLDDVEDIRVGDYAWVAGFVSEITAIDSGANTITLADTLTTAWPNGTPVAIAFLGGLGNSRIVPGTVGASVLNWLGLARVTTNNYSRNTWTQNINRGGGRVYDIARNIFDAVSIRDYLMYYGGFSFDLDYKADNYTPTLITVAASSTSLNCGATFDGETGELEWYEIRNSSGSYKNNTAVPIISEMFVYGG